MSLLLLLVASSLVPGMVIFFLREESHVLRTVLNLAGATFKIVLVAFLLWGVAHGRRYEARYPLLEGLDLVFHADPLSLLFVTLSAVLWLLTTIYAIGYLEGSPHRSRFFGFFSLCVSATVAIALAGNLFTFFIFYEMLTLSTYPLIVHRGTPEALRAGWVYLVYTLGGSTLLLLGVAWLRALVGPIEFTIGGFLTETDPSLHPTLVLIFALLISGMGVKAALVPLHGWLPVAMIAPAPVSALLHAVAVVKAGAFGIVRVMYDVYGIEFCRDLGLTLPVMAVAALTIVYGSVRALREDGLKRRLAFSTVSQVSYIALGAAIAGPAAIGGFVHLVHQGIMKITLFFCAGNLAESLDIHHVSEMRGVGRRMPWTMTAFTVGALGMIGLPPLAGFVSKWYLGLGAVGTGQHWILAVLVASTLLNAAYFLPIIGVAWFCAPDHSRPPGTDRGWAETSLMLLVPPVVTALLTLVIGIFAGAPWSPLQWAKLIVAPEIVP